MLASSGQSVAAMYVIPPFVCCTCVCMANPGFEIPEVPRLCSKELQQHSGAGVAVNFVFQKVITNYQG